MKRRRAFSAHTDPWPSVLRNAYRTRKAAKEYQTDLLTKAFEKEVLSILKRWSELPDLDPSWGPHVPLLVEARELYKQGHFYSCVAMCGITSERIVKDVLRQHIVIRRRRRYIKLPKAAVPELDRFELVATARFLAKAGLLEEAVRTNIQKLAELRNTYAHGSGQNPQSDSLRALEWLHDIIDRTVSIFKDHPPRSSLIGKSR